MDTLLSTIHIFSGSIYQVRISCSSSLTTHLIYPSTKPTSPIQSPVSNTCMVLLLHNIKVMVCILLCPLFFPQARAVSHLPPHQRCCCLLNVTNDGCKSYTERLKLTSSMQNTTLPFHIWAFTVHAHFLCGSYFFI